MNHVPSARRGSAALAATIAVLLVATSCSSNSTNTGAPNDTTGVGRNAGVVESADKPTPGGKITYGLVAETNGWNPGTNQWAPSGLQVTRAIFDTLTTYDKDLQVVPNLAASFTHNPEFTEWVITLRPNVVFHNGKPLTSDSIRRDIEYFKKSPVTRDAFTIMESLKTDGDLRLVIGLKQKWVNLPLAFATQVGVAAEPDWLESNDSKSPVGTGPFSLASWEIGSKLTVKKNPNYWRKDTFGTQLPYLDDIEFDIIGDEGSRAKTLVTGGVDIAEFTAATNVSDFQARADKGEFQAFNNNGGETAEVFIMLNTAKAPLDDIDARRALAYATDKHAVIDNLTNGLYEAADGPYSPSSRYFTKTDYPQFDQAKARELVDVVKARHGGSFTFDLEGPAGTGTDQALQMLSAQWAEVGIQANIRTREQAAGLIAVVTGDYQATLWQQFDSPNPISEVVWWIPENAKPIPEFNLNFARNKDDAISAAAKVLTQTEDPAEQMAQFKVLQERLAADIPYVWLYHTQLSIVASNKLVNVINATLPDGQQALGLRSGAHSLDQIWIRH
jgi:peptide/nickel transport system substrate-binding protein